MFNNYLLNECINESALFFPRKGLDTNMRWHIQHILLIHHQFWKAFQTSQAKYHCIACLNSEGLVYHRKNKQCLVQKRHKHLLHVFQQTHYYIGLHISLHYCRDLTVVKIPYLQQHYLKMRVAICLHYKGCKAVISVRSPHTYTQTHPQSMVVKPVGVTVLRYSQDLSSPGV